MNLISFYYDYWLFVTFYSFWYIVYGMYMFVFVMALSIYYDYYYSFNMHCECEVLQVHFILILRNAKHVLPYKLTEMRAFLLLSRTVWKFLCVRIFMSKNVVQFYLMQSHSRL